MLTSTIRKRLNRRFAIESLESRLALDARMLLDINSTPVARGSYPRMFTEINDEVYFLTSDIIGDELWRATDESAEKVVDFDLDLVVDGIFPGHLRKIDTFEARGDGIELQSGLTRLYLDENDNLSVTHSPSRTFGSSVTTTPLMDAETWRFEVQQFVDSPPGSDITIYTNELFHVTHDSKFLRLKNNSIPDFAGELTSSFSQIGDRVFMMHGVRLGITDGSLSEPPVVVESVSSPGAFQTVGELAYFFGGDMTSLNLWQSDGTAMGTSIVSTITTFAEDDIARPVVRQTLASSDELFFVYSEHPKTEPFRLWNSDGISTTSLIDLAFEGALSEPIEIGDRTLIPDIDEDDVLFNGELVPTLGSLISTDGTAEGTFRVINDQATLHSNPQFHVWNEEAYFLARTDAHGFELWKTDGTPVGTSMVRDIGPGTESANINDIRVWNDRLLFVADSDVGRELWVSDGTSGGTRPLDIYDGPESSNPTDFFEFEGRLFFLAETAIHGQELWTTDGTIEGTSLLRDINPGTSDSEPDQFFEFNGQLVFAAFNNATGSEFWTTDGTSEGTRILMDLSPGRQSTTPSEIAVIDNLIYFSSSRGDTGFEPWVSDGTLEGTRLIKNIVDEGTDSAIPRELTVAGDRVFFSADDGIHGQELWMTDGTPEGTQLVRDIAPGPASSDISEITAAGPNIYFTASDEFHGRELWFSDGTSDGTRMVADIVSGSIGSAPYNITMAGDSVYFAAFDFDHGDELWVSDGTSAGTRLVADVSPGESDSSPRDLLPHDGQLYFVASTFNHDRQRIQSDLWVTDGTDAGARMLQPSYSGCTSSSYAPQDLLIASEDLYFVRCYAVNKVTNEGFERIDLRSPSHTHSVSRLVAMNEERLLLLNGYGAIEWDVTSGQFGTFASFGPSPVWLVGTNNYTFAGNSVFFLYGHGVDLQRLSRGSVALREITGVDETMNNAAVSFELIDGLIYLVADHVDLGRELWRSDGTTAGTYVVTDIAPSSDDSHPSELLRFGDRLLFRATNDDVGSELWTIDIPQHTVEFDQPNWEIIEGGPFVGEQISISRHGPLDETLNVMVSFASETATSVGEPGFPDYVGNPAAYQFQPGEKTINIAPPTIFPDPNAEPTKALRMQLWLTDDTDYVTTVFSESTLTIYDDDFDKGDINRDGVLDSDDLDQLVRDIQRTSNTIESDLNDDGVNDIADIEIWLESAGRALNPTGEPFRFGDANLDGIVAADDFSLRFLFTNTLENPWTLGHDFNADGFNDGSDFNLWYENRTASVAAQSRPPRAALRALEEIQHTNIDIRQAVVSEVGAAEISCCVDSPSTKSQRAQRRLLGRRVVSATSPAAKSTQIDILLGNPLLLESILAND